MNKQEAIKELAYVKIKLKEANVFVSPSMDIAINMAIEALQEPTREWTIQNCPKCGKFVLKDWIVCPYCGASMRPKDGEEE